MADAQRFSSGVGLFWWIGLLVLMLSGGWHLTPSAEGVPDTGRTPLLPENPSAKQDRRDFYDQFYFDDSERTLNRITLEETVQTHNFHEPEDWDWLVLPITRAGVYSVKVTNLGAAVDPAVTLLDENLQVLENVDQNGSGVGLSENLVVSGAGTFYLQFRNLSDESSSFAVGDLDYEIRVTRNSAENVGIPTLEPLVGWVGPEGGVVPEVVSISSTGSTVLAEPPPFPTEYDQVRLLVEPGTFSEEIGIVLSDPRDNWAYPTLELTKAWRAGERAQSAAVVWLTVYVNEPSQAEFDPPLHLQLQLHDDALFYGFFPIDDIPQGKRAADAQVWQWDGSEWVLYDPAPQINGTLVKTEITRLQWNDLDFAEGYFGVFPSGTSSDVDAWVLY